MRVILGVVLCLVGALWVGQGTNVVHGSFMSGRALWAIIGGVLIVLGVAILVRAWLARTR